MTQADIYKDYLSFGNLDETEVDAEIIIGELEALLADPIASSKRVTYLESLTESVKGNADESNPTISDPLKSNQHRAIAEKGLVQAINDSDVTVDQLRRLAHSVEGLQAFSFALLTVPEDRQPDCWRNALSVPFDLPVVNIPESVWDQILKAASEWAGIVTPKMRRPVLGLRGTVTEKPKPVIKKDGVIEQIELLRNQLDKLRKLHGELPDGKISGLWNRIPWDKIKGTAKEGMTWEGFVRASGRLISIELTQADLVLLLDWIGSPEAGQILQLPDLRFITLIFDSPFLNIE